MKLKLKLELCSIVPAWSYRMTSCDETDGWNLIWSGWGCLGVTGFGAGDDDNDGDEMKERQTAADVSNTGFGDGCLVQ